MVVLHHEISRDMCISEFKMKAWALSPICGVYVYPMHGAFWYLIYVNLWCRRKIINLWTIWCLLFWDIIYFPGSESIDGIREVADIECRIGRKSEYRCFQKLNFKIRYSIDYGVMYGIRKISGRHNFVMSCDRRRIIDFWKQTSSLNISLNPFSN